MPDPYDPHPPDPRPKGRKGWRLRGLVLAGIASVPLAAALVADNASGIGPAARAYDARLTSAKALGFDPGFRARLARDAAKPEAARRAFESLGALLATPGLFRIGPPPGARTRESVRADLRRLASLARTAEGGGHRDWTQGPALALRDLANLRAAADAADALSREALARGHFAEATDVVVEAADLLIPYADDPVLITDLVRSGASAALFRTAGRLLADPAYPPAQAERLFRLADGPAFAPTVPPREFLLTEMVGGHDLLENPPADMALFGSGGGAATSRALDWGIRFGRVRRAWQSDALRLYADAARAMPRDPADFARVARGWEGLERAAAVPRGVVGAFGEVILPVFSQIVQMQRLRESRRRVLRLVAGLRAGRSEASLRAGGLGLDPTDGRPLRKRRTPGRMAFYALGRDGKDHGSTAPAKIGGIGDEVLVVPAR